MNAQAKIVVEVLEYYFPDVAPSLRYESPFQLLIATLLSAQCRDEQVNKVTPVLFAQAATPVAMRQLSKADISEIIHPCGFFKVKAHYIYTLARDLCERFQGQVPRTFAELESLPGVGHKTASVVMGHAFGELAFPVDTHIHRLAMKWKLSPGPSVERVERDLKKLFPSTLWFKLHLQMIDFGRQYCNRVACKPQHLCPMCQALAERLS